MQSSFLISILHRNFMCEFIWYTYFHSKCDDVSNSAHSTCCVRRTCLRFNADTLNLDVDRGGAKLPLWCIFVFRITGCVLSPRCLGSPHGHHSAGWSSESFGSLSQCNPSVWRPNGDFKSRGEWWQYSKRREWRGTVQHGWEVKGYTEKWDDYVPSLKSGWGNQHIWGSVFWGVLEQLFGMGFYPNLRKPLPLTSLRKGVNDLHIHQRTPSWQTRKIFYFIFVAFLHWCFNVFK